MLIKRVVIQGFKTFATRTEFSFDSKRSGGVTAIVGPNGSGKSNVVDAVRWCLGEQSFSLLRSKKTSDIIFAGRDNPVSISIPPFVAHGYKVLGSEKVRLFYHTSEVYDTKNPDEERLDWNSPEIGFDWSTKFK